MSVSQETLCLIKKTQHDTVAGGDQANVFVKKYGFTGEMFVSPDLSAYKAFKLVRGQSGRRLFTAALKP